MGFPPLLISIQALICQIAPHGLRCVTFLPSCLPLPFLVMYTTYVSGRVADESHIAVSSSHLRTAASRAASTFIADSNSKAVQPPRVPPVRMPLGVFAPAVTAEDGRAAAAGRGGVCAAQL